MPLKPTRRTRSALSGELEECEEDVTEWVNMIREALSGVARKARGERKQIPQMRIVCRDGGRIGKIVNGRLVILAVSYGIRLLNFRL